MAGLFFDSGIDDGFEKDLNKMNDLVNQFEKEVVSAGDKAEKSFKGVDDVLSNLSTAPLDHLTKAADHLNAEINLLDRSTTEYKKKAGDLSKVENEISKVQKQMQGATTQAQSFWQKLKGIGGEILPFAGISGAIAAIGSVLVNAYNKIKEFASGISELKAITGLAGQDLDFLKEKAKNMAAQYGTSATEIVTAMKLVGSAKPELLSNAEGLSAMTESVMILSKASGLDLTTATNALAGSLNQFNAPASKAGEYIDILASAAQKGTREIPFLSDFILRTGKIAADSGISFKELAARAELLGPSFQSPELAATGFEAVLRNLKKEGLGFTTGQFNMSEALQTVKDKLNGMGSELERNNYQQKIFGDAMTAGKVLLETNGAALKEFTDSIGKSGSAMEQAAIQMDNLQGDLDKAGGAWDRFVLGIEDGNGVLSKAVRGVIQAFTWMIDQSGRMAKSTEVATKKLGEMWNSNSFALNQLKSWAGDVFNFFAKMNPVLGKAASWLKEIFTIKPTAKVFKEVVIDKEAIKKQVIAEFEATKKAQEEAKKKAKYVSDEDKAKWKKAYAEQLTTLQNHLTEQKQRYDQYNQAIQGLSDARKSTVKGEYASLIDTGKTYLQFLNDLLSKEKDTKKQAVIKKEISTISLEQTITEQQTAQKDADKKAEELKKLLDLYQSYADQRKEIESKYQKEAELLRSASAEAEAIQSEQAMKEELDRLDASILASDAKFQEWLKETLPSLAKSGVEALQHELNSVQFDIYGTSDPEKLVIYQEKIKQINKLIDEKNSKEGEGKTSWKDTLEIMNGVNSLAQDIVSSFGDLDSSSKLILSTITNLSSGFVNIASGISAIGAAKTGLESVSATLAVIGTAIKVVTAIDAAFKQAREERVQSYIAELKQIEAVNKTLVEQNALYKEGNEYFSSDKWGKALAGLDAYNQALGFSNDILKEIALNNEQATLSMNMTGVTKKENQNLLNIQEAAKSYGTELEKALASVAITTKERSKIGSFFGLSNEYRSLLELYPNVIDATGKLDTTVLQTILDTSKLSETDRTRLENLIEMTNAAEAAYSQFGEYVSGIFGGMADEITTAFQAMYEGGADAMTSLEASFSDMIESFTRDAIEFAFLQPLLDSLNSTTKLLGEQYAKGKITSEDLQKGVLDSLGSFYAQINNVQPLILDAFKNADQLAAQAGFDSAFNPTATGTAVVDTATATTASSVAGQIAQSITEETGGILSGHLAAIMNSNQVIVNQGIDALEYAVQNLLYMKQIKVNTDYLPEIAENTRKTYQKLESI